MADDEYTARARELTSPGPDGIRVRLHPASCEASLRDLAAALRAERMRGRREGLERAASQCVEVAAREKAGALAPRISADEMAVRDGGWLCAAELRDRVSAIDPESW